MSNYYLDNGYYEYYLDSDFWQSERDWLVEENAHLLTVSQANQLNIQHFFYKNTDDIKPHLNRDYHYLTLPYELGEEVFPDLCAGHFIVNALNPHMSGRSIFIASTDNDICCVVSCKKLSDDLVAILSTPHINTPFLIFNEQADNLP